MAEHTFLLPVWKALSDDLNQHQLTTLKCAFKNTARRLSLHKAIVENPGLLNMTLTLDFRLGHRDNLGTGLPQFCLGQHNSASSKLLKVRVDRHQVIAGVGGAPTLSDKEYLTAPDGVTLPETLAMTQSVHARLRVVLDTLLGRYQPTYQGIDIVGSAFYGSVNRVGGLLPL